MMITSVTAQNIKAIPFDMNGMIFEPPGAPRADEQDQTIVPDALIQVLSELLDQFRAQR